MATGKITKRAVDALTAGDKDTYLWDSAIKGFALKVTPRGTKTYLYEYKDDLRKTRRVTIGHHGVITAEQARTKAGKIAADVELGGDPAANHSRHKSAPTVASLAEQWMQDHIAVRRKPKTINDYRGWLDRHILPKIGSLRVPDIKPRDVERIALALSQYPTTANRVVAVMSSMFSHAIRQGVLSKNPATGIEKFKEDKRDRHLSPDELHRLGAVLNDAEARGDYRPGIDAIRLLLLTGMRRGEVETLQWNFVDLASSRIFLPDSKSGKKSIPLGKPVVSLLESIRDKQISDGIFEADGFVIPGQTSHLVGLPKMWRKWRSEAGLNDVRIHDLRHSWASIGASNGTPLFVIGGVLGQVSSSTTERYAHLQNDPAKTAVEAISSTIAAALSPNDSED